MTITPDDLKPAERIAAQVIHDRFRTGDLGQYLRPPRVVTARNHPAKWSAPIADRVDAIVRGRASRLCPRLDGPLRVLDPFAGVGGLLDRLAEHRDVEAIGVELEDEWAIQGQRVLVGDSTRLPSEWRALFDIVVTSPVYGNRMSDHHEAKDACGTCKGSGCQVADCLGAHPDDGQDHKRCTVCKGEGLSKRNTYTHQLGRLPTDGSSAVMEFPGRAYERLHVAVWAEVARVTAPAGLFVLNVKNFLTDNGLTELRPTEWHLTHLLQATGAPVRPGHLWELEALAPVPVKGQRQGAHGHEETAKGVKGTGRVGHETIAVLRRTSTPAPA